MNKHKRILVNSAIIVNRAAELLDQNNIPNRIKNNVESARLAGFGSPSNNVELYVDVVDEERAKEIIESFLKS